MKLPKRLGTKIKVKPKRRPGLRLKGWDLKKWFWDNRIVPMLTKRGDCWEWDKAQVKDYGQLRIVLPNGKEKLCLTHRIALEIKLKRELKEEEWSLHTCDNPKCNNPGHLYLGTQKENMRDMMERGRNGGQFPKGHVPSPLAFKKGEESKWSKLTEEQVKGIRSLWIPGKYGYKRIAKRFGISNEGCRAILIRRTWKHVE